MPLNDVLAKAHLFLIAAAEHPPHLVKLCIHIVTFISKSITNYCYLNVTLLGQLSLSAHCRNHFDHTILKTQMLYNDREVSLKSYQYAHCKHSLSLCNPYKHPQDHLQTMNHRLKTTYLIGMHLLHLLSSQQRISVN
jgi:hypothetical protein